MPPTTTAPSPTSASRGRRTEWWQPRSRQCGGRRSAGRHLDHRGSGGCAGTVVAGAPVGAAVATPTVAGAGASIAVLASAVALFSGNRRDGPSCTVRKFVRSDRYRRPLTSAFASSTAENKTPVPLTGKVGLICVPANQTVPARLSATERTTKSGLKKRTDLDLNVRRTRVGIHNLKHCGVELRSHVGCVEAVHTFHDEVDGHCLPL